jgi:hypothetical protein
MILTRPWGLLVSALLGAGFISVTIPLWGWILIGILCVAIIFLAIKYAPQIEERSHILMDKLNHRKNNIS